MQTSLSVLSTTIIWAAIFKCSASEGTNGVEEETRLLERLKSSLPKHRPPKDMRNDSVHIFVDLYSISDVNEKDGYLYSKMWLWYYYYTDSAKWNSSEMSISTIQVPPYTFWHADIIALDAIDALPVVFDRQVVFGSNGMVIFYSTLVSIKFACAFDVSHFPTDSHKCTLRFGQWTSSKFHYRITMDPMIPTVAADLKHYQDNDEWDLVRPVPLRFGTHDWRGQAYMDHLEIVIQLQRRGLFYNIVFMLPNILLYMLSTLVFVIPVESGEKVGFSMTILLAAVVSFGAISEMLPASSLNFPVIAYFLALVVSHMALDTFLTTIVINVHFMDDRFKMRTSLRKIISGNVPIFFGLKPCPIEKALPRKRERDERNQLMEQLEKGHNQENVKKDDGDDDGKNQKWASVANRLRKASQVALETAAGTNKHKSFLLTQTNQFLKAVDQVRVLESEENMDFLWQYLATLIDRVFLYLHIIIAITVMIGFFGAT